jgi:hypothetical protein
MAALGTVVLITPSTPLVLSTAISHGEVQMRDYSPYIPPAGTQTTGQLWPMGMTAAATHTHTNVLLPTRQTTQFSTFFLADQAEETGTVTMAPGYRLLRVATSVPARVRLYTSTAQRTADAPRPAGQDPTGDHGLVMEFITTFSDLDWFLTPAIDGYTSSGSSVYWAVANRSGGSVAIATTLTWIKTEDT